MTTAADRINATLTDEARDGLRTIISLDGFLALKGEARAARWRGLDHGGKFQLVALQIERLGYDWMPSDVEAQIAKYDEKYTAGPLELAVEGALERLALEHSQAAMLADRLGDTTHRKAERAAATAFTNALIEYKAGVRPQLLPSGAWLLPSRRAGEPPHIVHMAGDWVCSCKAGASMHWPLALVIGIEVSQDDMQAFDDGPDTNADRAAAQLAERLDATTQILDAMRAVQGRTALSFDPPIDIPQEPQPPTPGGPEPPIWPEPGGVTKQLGQRLAQARRYLLEAA